MLISRTKWQDKRPQPALQAGTSNMQLYTGA